MKVEILRTYLPTETLGSIMINDVCEAKSMELPWKDNKHNESCYPEGEYDAVKELWTEKHPYPHIRVLNVPYRDGILWHKITYVKDLRGCTGVGSRFQDLNGDGVPDMVESTKGLEHLISLLPDRFKFTVRKK